MGEYIDLVLVRHRDIEWEKPYLFYAPPWSYLGEDDMVMCDTKKGEQFGKVVAINHMVRVESEEFDFNVKASQATLPLKRVMRKVEYIDLNYEDANEEDKCDGNANND